MTQPASRRAFLALLLAAPHALAQVAGRSPRVACLLVGTAESNHAESFAKRIEKGLREAGVPAVEIRFFFAASDDYEVMLAAAREAVAWAPDALFAPGPLNAMAAHKATRTLPVVFFGVPDPEDFGLVQSLARPGGNATGSAINAATGTVKRLELVRELLPGARRVAIVFRRRPGADVTVLDKVRRRLGECAALLKLGLEEAEVGGTRGFTETLAGLGRRPPDAVLPFGPYVWEPDGSSPDVARLFLQFERKHRVPVMSEMQHAVDMGCTAAMYDVGSQLGEGIGILAQVLKGVPPAQIPVALPTRFHLALNRTGARAIGITLAPALLVRADRMVD
jgi:putative ABC transport system substrate-binding protein